MTNEQHLILPSEELVQQWISQWVGGDTTLAFYIATQAAQLSADQELKACCEWLDFYSSAGDARDLRLARRHEPPSLKERALEALDRMDQLPTAESLALIREALEAL